MFEIDDVVKNVINDRCGKVVDIMYKISYSDDTEDIVSEDVVEEFDPMPQESYDIYIRVYTYMYVSKYKPCLTNEEKDTLVTHLREVAKIHDTDLDEDDIYDIVLAAEALYSAVPKITV